MNDSFFTVLGKTIGIGLVFVVCSNALLHYCNNSQLQEPTKEISDSVEIKGVSFDTLSISIENIYLVCDSLKMPFKRVIAAQGILESANFTSSLFKKNNNFLGLYNSRKGTYFKFKHWTDCLIGYRDMIQYRYKPDECYYQFLKRIKYAEDSLYINKIKNIEKTLYE